MKKMILVLVCLLCLTGCKENARETKIENNSTYVDSNSSEEAVDTLEDTLDAAITDAILNYHRKSEPDGLICAESHVILTNEKLSATPVLNGGEHTEKAVVSLAVYYAKYSVQNGALVEAENKFSSARITFRIENESTYILEEFCDSCEETYSTDTYDTLKEKAYSKALEYLRGKPTV